MISIKRSVSFVAEPDRRGNSDGTEGVLRCIIVWNRKRVRVAVGHRVTLSGWLPEVQQCKPRSYHGRSKTPATLINRDIGDIEAQVDAVFRDYELNDTIPTTEEFRDKLNEKLGRVKESGGDEDKSIFPAFDAFISEHVRMGRWRERTLGEAQRVRRILYEISPTMTFEELDESGHVAVVEYLSKRYDKKGQVGLRNSTINGIIRVVKRFVRWAVNGNTTTAGKFLLQKARLRSANRPIIFLTWDELMSFYDLDLTGKRTLEQARDVFCFCCFTSLRYSDVRNLRKADVGENSITITTIKTDDRLEIELNKYSRAILEKYRNTQLPDERALPVQPITRYNARIKLLGKLCGFDTPISVTTHKGALRENSIHPKYELLSSHAARRTFISNALMLGIPPDIVMKWSGHSDYKAMKPYIAIADEAKRSAMDSFDKR